MVLAHVSSDKMDFIVVAHGRFEILTPRSSACGALEILQSIGHALFTESISVIIL